MQSISDELSQNTKEVERVVKPMFFKYVDKNVDDNIYKLFDCPMDYVIKNVKDSDIKVDQSGTNKKAGEKNIIVYQNILIILMVNIIISKYQ